MDASDLKVLQAASKGWNEARPQRSSVQILTEYAKASIPERSDLPPDELATVVGLKLMKVPGDPK